MTNSNKIAFLQLFAGEGDGGAGGVSGGSAATVASGNAAAADDGQQRLRELGVPEDVLRKRAKRNAAKERGRKQDAAAQPKQPKVQDGRMTWEEIMADPEYNGEMQKVVKARLKADKQTAHVPVNQRNMETYDVRSHFDGLHSQAKALQRQYPNFDLQKELENEQFFRLTSPHVGLSVEDAYMALHHREVSAARNRAVAQGVRREVAESIRSGSMRPRENGTASKAATVTTFDYKNATRSQKQAFKKSILDAHARGEKIYPGGR